LSYVQAGDFSKLSHLIDIGIDLGTPIDDCGNSAAHVAALNGHIDVLSLLQERNVHIDNQNTKGETAVMAAALNDQTACLLFLVENGSSIGIRDHSGQLVTHLLAARDGHAALQQLYERLCTKDTSIATSSSDWSLWEQLAFSVDGSGCSPCHRAACMGHNDTVSWFASNYAATRTHLTVNAVFPTEQTLARIDVMRRASAGVIERSFYQWFPPRQKMLVFVSSTFTGDYRQF
jgi:hypothetical protein